jgi:large subunit ribosomal protein L10
MPTAKKIRDVEALTDKLLKSSVAIATGFTGASVNSMTELRKHLRSEGIEYKVVKNTLVEIAADIAGRPEVKWLLEGPTAIAFGEGDPTVHIKSIVGYLRANRLPIIVRGAMLDGRVFTGVELTELVNLPSRDILNAQFVGLLGGLLVRLVTSMNRPLQGLSNALNAPLTSLATVLHRRIEQQGGS